jgi:hypothetical protein
MNGQNAHRAARDQPASHATDQKKLQKPPRAGGGGGRVARWLPNFFALRKAWPNSLSHAIHITTLATPLLSFIACINQIKPPFSGSTTGSVPDTEQLVFERSKVQQTQLTIFPWTYQDAYLHLATHACRALFL